jgi:hypothetical protein
MNASSVKELGIKGLEISYTSDRITRGRPIVADGVRLNKTGEPDLPSLMYKIGLPQDGDFEITITRGREEVLKDITIDPVIMPSINEPSLHELEPTRSNIYKQNDFLPRDFMEISQPGYFRDIYTVSVRVNPVQYNPVTRELRVVQNFTIHVRFKTVPKSKPIIDKGFENMYKQTIINYAQCKNWRREPMQVMDNPFETGVWFKIEVNEEGLYKIDHDVRSTRRHLSFCQGMCRAPLLIHSSRCQSMWLVRMITVLTGKTIFCFTAIQQTTMLLIQH